VIENAIKGKGTTPETVFLIMTYTLASALSISPLEIYKMPSSLVMDLLRVHFSMEKIKHDELEKAKKNAGR
jgi:hypothetical protein|tara:strand:- start:1429 stop:1641 length:213 start_codon:yes stop_codon:yes gene_type:complete